MTAAEPDLIITDEFAAALEQLTDGGHLFLTGKAGTGKSTLIRHFMNTTERVVTVVAPTGIAALNVGGYTIHRLFSFQPGTTVEDVRSGRYHPARFSGVLQKLQTLIIDEASMVRADLFDLVAAALERFGPFPHTPFGGVQIVLVGDLYQLSPVVAEHELPTLTQRYRTPYFFSADAYRAAEIPTVELTHVFRQQGDPALISILNAVRDGSLLPDARAALNERTDPDFEPPLDQMWVTLTTTNRLATARNRQALSRLDPPEYTSHAAIEGDLDGAEQPTDEVLAFRIGAQVMMLTNDAADRWVNGTIARIVGVSRQVVRSSPLDGEESRRGSRFGARGGRAAGDSELVVTVALPDGTVVDVEPHTWDVTRPRLEGGTQVHEVVGTFTQLPFRLAWAITIHKSQGQTLDNLVVDLSGGTFADGQLYVALSRATSLDGLVLRRPVLAKDLRVDSRVRRFFATIPGLASRTGGGLREASSVVYVGVAMVGDEGSRWKPRPVELAFVFEDGREVTTLVNPTRDLGDSRTRFGISAQDVQLAPVLGQAWAALAPLLTGAAPVGVDVDTLLGHLDFELKRGGVVTPFPVGVDAESIVGAGQVVAAVSRSRTALDKARAVRDHVAPVGVNLRGINGFGGPLVEGGYLLPRPDAKSPVVFLTDLGAEGLADAIGEAVERGPLTTRNEAVVRALGNELGVPIPGLHGSRSDGTESADCGDEREPAPDISDVLVPGARVCFTGDPFHDGHFWGRGDMEDLAVRHDLVPAAGVTKTRTDALVTAEAGSQSGKARNALKWGTPTFTADEFFAWAGLGDAGGLTTDAPATAPDAVTVQVRALEDHLGPHTDEPPADEDDAPF